MIRTKKILALFLAVVLMFSALPFSVSADEIEMVEMDTPIFFAQDPFTQVKNEVEGGTNYMTSVGVTRESIVRELESHEHDNYYLGTKYVGGDAQSPNGDASYNSGSVGMNCGGFVAYVLRKAGLDAETTMEIMHRTPVNQFGSGLPYDWLAGASNYKNLIENGQISAYAFRTKQELLSSGLAEKGDIILMWWSDSPGADGADNHIGFFWGEASDDDVMWHSGTEPTSGNQISAITPKTPGSFYILIKIEPLQPKEYTVTLTKTSADVSITQGNSAYSLAGATYNVYKGTSGTGSVVATFTTDEAGHATLSTPLEDGTYSVKEVTPPKGYKLDPKVYTFTIDGSDTSLSVEDEPGTLTLKLKKKDSQTGSTPQGNASSGGSCLPDQLPEGRPDRHRGTDFRRLRQSWHPGGHPLRYCHREGTDCPGRLPAGHSGPHLHRGRQPAHRRCVRARSHGPGRGSPERRPDHPKARILRPEPHPRAMQVWPGSPLRLSTRVRTQWW